MYEYISHSVSEQQPLTNYCLVLDHDTELNNNNSIVTNFMRGGVVCCGITFLIVVVMVVEMETNNYLQSRSLVT